MNTLITYLNSIHPLSEELKCHLLNTVKTIYVPKKGFIVEPGHICRNIFFIESGIVRHYRMERGNEITFHIMEKNGIVFNVESFCKKSFSSQFIQAVEPTGLHYVSISELQNIFCRFSEFQTIFWELVSHYNITRGLREQVLCMKYFKDRYKHMLLISPHISSRVSKKVLASYLGCAGETLSRIKKPK